MTAENHPATARIGMKAELPDDAQRRAAFTYNAAADFFDASPELELPRSQPRRLSDRPEKS